MPVMPSGTTKVRITVWVWFWVALAAFLMAVTSGVAVAAGHSMIGLFCSGFSMGLAVGYVINEFLSARCNERQVSNSASQ
jgi:uncharacterized metal-binding protein